MRQWDSGTDSRCPLGDMGLPDNLTVRRTGAFLPTGWSNLRTFHTPLLDNLPPKAAATFGPEGPVPFGSCATTFPPAREALIKSLSAFILEFLCNVRNGLTRIASYLRKPMTKQCIKILIKENSMN